MKAFVIDVDGVLTDGKMYYTAEGKLMKTFGPDDHEALHLLDGKLQILFTSGDHRGFPISQRRVHDMGFEIVLTSQNGERKKMIEDRFGLKDTIYMGDGIYDAALFRDVGYAICPRDAFYLARQNADYITYSRGGERAVAEACFHILEKFCVRRGEKMDNLEDELIKLIEPLLKKYKESVLKDSHIDYRNFAAHDIAKLVIKHISTW